MYVHGTGYALYVLSLDYVALYSNNTFLNHLRVACPNCSVPGLTQFSIPVLLNSESIRTVLNTFRFRVKYRKEEWPHGFHIVTLLLFACNLIPHLCRERALRQKMPPVCIWLETFTVYLYLYNILSPVDSGELL